jgi:hypothetical protein
MELKPEQIIKRLHREASYTDVLNGAVSIKICCEANGGRARAQHVITNGDDGAASKVGETEQKRQPFTSEKNTKICTEIGLYKKAETEGLKQ